MNRSTGVLDPYVVLGVPEDADEATVKAAYRRRCKLAHPDRHVGADEETRRAAEEEMAQLNWAWAEVRRRGEPAEPATTTVAEPAPVPDDEAADDEADAAPERHGRLRGLVGWLAAVAVVLTGAFVLATGVGAWAMINIARSQAPERLTADLALSDCAVVKAGDAVGTDCGPGVQSVAMITFAATECIRYGFTPARSGGAWVCLV